MCDLSIFTTLITLKIALFLVRPGDGDEFEYSPVNVNATLHCAVNNTNLEWEVDGLAFDSDVQRSQLNSKGISQRGPIVSPGGVISSSVIVFGSIESNNNSRICCQIFVNELKENCITLVVYGKVNTILPLSKTLEIIFVQFRSTITTNTSVCSKC